MVQLQCIFGALVIASLANVGEGDRCTEQQTYMKLLDDLKTHPCMTDIKVISQLHHIRYTDCRHRIAQFMYRQVGNTDGSNECSCGGTIHHLHVPPANHTNCDSHYKVLVLQNSDKNIRVVQDGHCFSENDGPSTGYSGAAHTRGAIEHYYASSPQCRTHHALWDDYHSLVSGSHGNSALCDYELTTRLFLALNARGTNDCQCSKAGSHVHIGNIELEACNNPATDCQYEHCTGGYVSACVNQMCTCHAPSTELVRVPCNKGKTLMDIALNLSPGSHKGCGDHVHSPPWQLIPSLCNMRVHRYAVLSPGEKVSIYTCGICKDLTFDQSIICKRHMTEQHSGFGYRCPTCRALVGRSGVHTGCDGLLETVNKSTMTFTKEDQEMFMKFQRERDSKMIVEKVTMEERKRRTAGNRKKSKSSKERRSPLANIYPEKKMSYGKENKRPKEKSEPKEKREPKEKKEPKEKNKQKEHKRDTSMQLEEKEREVPKKKRKVIVEENWDVLSVTCSAEEDDMLFQMEDFKRFRGMVENPVKPPPEIEVRVLKKPLQEESEDVSRVEESEDESSVEQAEDVRKVVETVIEASGVVQTTIEEPVSREENQEGNLHTKEDKREQQESETELATQILVQEMQAQDKTQERNSPYQMNSLYHPTPIRELKLQKVAQSQSNRFIINVGGTRFETSAVSINSVTGNFLEALIDKNSGVQPYAVEGRSCYFLDRDPKHFPLILNYMRNGGRLNSDMLPRDLKQLRELQFECRFYELDHLLGHIQQRIDLIQHGSILF